jgi:hypothetical protein
VSFLRKVQERLCDFEAKSDVINGTIEFKRITNSLPNKRDALKILREGFIRVERIGADRIQIFWEIKLDNTLFLSFMTGLVMGLFTVFTGSTIVFAGIVTLLFTIMAYFITYSIVRIKIDGIVESSV